MQKHVPQEKFDYIVVGAGSAGSAIASRLSENGRHNVLLLEAGHASHYWSPIPIGFGKLINNPAANWCYASEGEDGSNGRKIPVPRGKLLGGSSAINGMVFVRGQSQDFDHWAQLGNRGWSYRDVLPYFKRLESYEGGDNEHRGRDGPIKVTLSTEKSPLYDALFAAAEQVGIKRNPDYNGAVQDGIAMTQTNISSGWRQSTARCYLDPARRRGNLKIQSDALAEALLFDGKRCTGVRYRVGANDVREALAHSEVIVSTGAINSPQLLELSGIGRPEVLKAHGIDVRHALAGVGENLRDHYAPRMKWLLAADGLTYNQRARGIGLAMQAIRWGITGKGFMAMPASPMRCYFKTREGLESPDACFTVMPFIVTPDMQLAKERGLTVVVHQLRQESLGSIHIGSASASKPPVIRFNFLTNSIDRDCVIAAMRTTRRVFEAEPMKKLGTDEIAPGIDVQSDDELLTWVKANAETAYHPVGTCKMGPEGDPMAVVDDRLRVRGIEGLRVADASIMPTLTSGNTNAPSMMIGEKAAAMVLERARAA